MLSGVLTQKVNQKKVILKGKKFDGEFQDNLKNISFGSSQHNLNKLQFVTQVLKNRFYVNFNYVNVTFTK